MAEGDTTKNRLWWFRQPPGGVLPREVDFAADEPIYQLYRNTHNPYVQRALAPATRKLERGKEELARLEHVVAQHYHLGPANRSDPYRQRMVKSAAPAAGQPAERPAPGQPRFVEPQRLSGDVRKLPWLIDAFFASVIGRLEADPWAFDEVAEELMALLNENRIPIKLYEAYQTLQDWEDLMETLREIARYPAPETFDLFCSAVIVYYGLVHPQ